MAKILNFNEEASKLSVVKVSKERLDAVERDYVQHLRNNFKIALEQPISLPEFTLNDFETWLEESGCE